MTREDKKKIERRAYWHDLLRQLRGTPDFPVKLFFHALFLVGAVYVAKGIEQERQQCQTSNKQIGCYSVFHCGLENGGN